jgi:hypothetical protein
MAIRQLSCSQSKYDETAKLLSVLGVSIITTRRAPHNPTELMVEVEHENFTSGASPLALLTLSDWKDGAAHLRVVLADIVLLVQAAAEAGAAITDSNGEVYKPVPFKNGADR